MVQSGVPGAATKEREERCESRARAEKDEAFAASPNEAQFSEEGGTNENVAVVDDSGLDGHW